MLTTFEGISHESGMEEVLKISPFDITYHARHIYPMNAIHISIRELHAHTGRYVEKATNQQRVVITFRGKPVAEIKPYDEQEKKKSRWQNRILTPAFRKLQESGALKIPSDRCDLTKIISDDRDREAL